DIFAQRARTKEGRLQVEAAQLHHLLPRLVGGRDLSGLGAGVGTRGPGEQKLESDRRRIRHRIRELEKDIKEIRKQRALRREGRRRIAFPVVAIVGYTNSRKPTSCCTCSTPRDTTAAIRWRPCTRRCRTWARWKNRSCWPLIRSINCDLGRLRRCSAKIGHRIAPWCRSRPCGRPDCKPWVQRLPRHFPARWCASRCCCRIPRTRDRRNFMPRETS